VAVDVLKVGANRIINTTMQDYEVYVVITKEGPDRIKKSKLK
jgi:hypothetical protein